VEVDTGRSLCLKVEPHRRSALLCYTEQVQNLGRFWYYCTQKIQCGDRSLCFPDNKGCWNFTAVGKCSLCDQLSFLGTVLIRVWSASVSHDNLLIIKYWSLNKSQVASPVWQISDQADFANKLDQLHFFFSEMIGSNIERVEPADIGLFIWKNMEYSLLVENHSI